VSDEFLVIATLFSFVFCIQVTELEIYVKSSQSVIMQKNREIAELRKDRDRQLSQNRLAQLKAAVVATATATDMDENDHNQRKKSRHSY
jgi:uncharacterized membrane protein YgaE (UPF0421/DUF939 family)